MGSELEIREDVAPIQLSGPVQIVRLLGEATNVFVLDPLRKRMGTQPLLINVMVDVRRVSNISYSFIHILFDWKNKVKAGGAELKVLGPFQNEPVDMWSRAPVAMKTLDCRSEPEATLLASFEPPRNSGTLVRAHAAGAPQQ